MTRRKQRDPKQLVLLYAYLIYMAVVTAVTADPEWTIIADGIVIGRTPTSPQELEQLLSQADVKAVMCLQVRRMNTISLRRFKSRGRIDKCHDVVCQ